jgi:hypothetical protein
MTESTLAERLNPARFPSMSPQMAAILGFLFEQAYTTPQLIELVVTPDGHVLGRAEDAAGPLAYLAAEADLRANLRRLGIAAGLSEVEWEEYAECVRERIGMELGTLRAG